MTVQEQAVQLLKERADGSLYALRRELEKLSAYVPAGRPVLAKDVEMVGGTEPGASVFDLLTAIGARASGRAFTILTRNFEAGEAPLRILGALIWQYRRLWRVKEAMGQSGRPGEAGRALRMDPAQAAALLAEFDDAHLTQAFTWFLEADSKLKGGSGASAKRVMEDLLLRLCHRPRLVETCKRSSPSEPVRKPSGLRPMSNVKTIRTGKR
jgi:DNA polymerase-3 subunit delta